MNKLYILIIILLVAFTSCDGRDRKHKTNAEVLTENKLLVSFSEEIKFIPENRIEIITDTILSNDFRVKIKYYSLDDDYVLKTHASYNDSLVKHHYKNFEAKFQVLKNNKIIAESYINKGVFSKFENSNFWSNAIMQHIWVDYNNSTEKSVKLNTTFHLPETNIYKDYTIIIDEFGNIQIKEINLALNTI